jgi:drug/metabolite transporter (DMT)-like permease
MKDITIGLLFSLLWATASVVTKIGLKSVQPLVMADVRFCIAAFIMLIWAYILRGGKIKHAMPKGNEWRALALYGLLNITIYLGAFGLAIKEVAAGIGTLSIAVNPLIISVLSAIWLGRAVKRQEWWGLVLGFLGVGIATYPLLVQAYATVKGLAILFISMLSYSVGTVYFSSIPWRLSRLVINAWQIFFGGLFLLPFVVLSFESQLNRIDANFLFSIFWLVFPVSILAVQLWLYLLNLDPVKASLWLFLCPIFGFAYAYLLLNEPLSIYTFAGTGLVILGLYLGQRA